MGVGVASSGSGGQGFAFKLEGDGDSKIGNSSGDLHQITGTLDLTGLIKASTTVSGAGAISGKSLTTEESTISVAGAMSGAGLVSANALTTEEASISVAGVFTGSGGISGQSLTIANLTKVNSDGVLSSSAGSTLGNLILQDDATSLQLSGTLVAQKISSSVGATIGNLILNDDSTSLQLSGNILMSDQASLGATAIYDPTGSSVTQVTGTLDIKGWRVNAVTRTNLGTGTTTTLTASTGVHFLDADSANAAATGHHEISLCTGSIDGQELKLVVTGTLNAGVRLFPGASTNAVGSITSTGVAGNGQTITLKGPGGGTSYVIQAFDDAGLPCGQAARVGATQYFFGINGCTGGEENAVGIYTALATAISGDSWPFTLGSFSPGSDTVVSITSSAGGTNSNQTTTENMDNVTVTGMAGGTQSPSTVNSTYGVSLASNQGCHLIFDVDSNKWQVIAGTQLAS